jgi:hypothetical protein
VLGSAAVVVASRGLRRGEMVSVREMVSGMSVREMVSGMSVQNSGRTQAELRQAELGVCTCAVCACHGRNG